MAAQTNQRPRNQESPFITELATVLGIPENPAHAEKVLCAVFQIIRERVPPIASSALIAPLPLEVKKLYMAGWNRKFFPKKEFNYDQFIDTLYEFQGTEHFRLFRSRGQVKESVSVIFEVIKRYVSTKQYGVMMSLMPLILRINLSADYIFEGQSYFL
jgi:uncharacterized protein (DUF2267 family)